MKKLLISALALVLCGNVMAQDPKEVKAQQKAISGLLKEAEKASKVSEDAMGQVDTSKVPDFATAMAKIAEANANQYASTMAGDIARTAAGIMNNKVRFNTPGAMAGDDAALKDYLLSCGEGFKYLQQAWEAYKVPDEKGKVNTKYNDKMAADAANFFINSSGLYNSALIAYQAEDWMNSAAYFDLAGDAIGCEMLEHAKAKNPLLVANMVTFETDSAKYKNKIFAASTYKNANAERALEAYKALVGTPASQFDVFSGIVTIYSEKADTTSMVEWLQKGMEVMPEDSRFATSLFYIYLDKGDYEGAISSLKATLNNTPDNISVITLIARLYTQQGQFAEATPYYQKALALDAENLDANLYYGLNYLSEMEAGESEMLKNHAREAEMDAYSNGKLDAALPYLRKAFQLDTNHENNDIATLLMQVLYRKFQPSGAQNKAALIAEYNEVADAYGRPTYNR